MSKGHLGLIYESLSPLRVEGDVRGRVQTHSSSGLGRPSVGVGPAWAAGHWLFSGPSSPSRSLPQEAPGQVLNLHLTEVQL